MHISGKNLAILAAVFLAGIVVAVFFFPTAYDKCVKAHMAQWDSETPDMSDETRIEFTAMAARVCIK